MGNHLLYEPSRGCQLQQALDSRGRNPSASLAPGNAVATYWVRIDKARKVLARSSEVPAFF